MRGAVLAALLLTACNGAPEEASEAEIANRAESLERAADATTDDLINQIDAQTNEDMAEDAPEIESAPADNASNATQ